MAFNFGTNQTHTGGGTLIVPADAQLAISDQHVEALMGGHASNVPDTRRRNVTQPRLHDAYMGSNEFLANTMIDLLLTSDISFVTTELMPMFHHDDPLLKWKEISEDNGIMEPEQEGGVPSLKSSSMQEFSAYMQRFGRAAIFSHGFANTEGGRSLFRLRLGHMAKEIQRTLDIRGLYAIIASQKHYVRLFSNLPEDYKSGGAVNAIDCFERELATFAMLQKNERGLYALDERLRRQLELNGANPDAWIMLSEMMSHCAMESAEVERYRAGPVGRIHLEKGKGAMASFRGCKVHVVKDYDVYGRAINAFKRTRMIGDFWPIRDVGYGKKFGPKFPMNQRCQTDVYCCGTDRFENFGLRAALQKCGVFKGLHGNGANFVYSEAMETWKNSFNPQTEQDIKVIDVLLLRETPLIYTVYEYNRAGHFVADVRLFNMAGNRHGVLDWLKQLHRAGRYVDPRATNGIFIGIDALDLCGRFFGLLQTPTGPSSDPAAPAKQDGTGTGQLIIATDEKSSHEVVKIASAMKGVSQSSDAAASIQQILSLLVPGFAGGASLEHAEIKEFTKTFHDCMTACAVDETSDGPSGAYFSVLNDAFKKSQAENSQEQLVTFQCIQKELGSRMSVAQLMATVALGFAYSQNNETTGLVFGCLKALVSSMEPVLRDQARAKAMVTASCNLYRQGSAVLHWAKQGEAAMQQFASSMQKVASDLAVCDDTDVVVKKHKGRDRLAAMYVDAARFVSVYTTNDEEADMTCTIPRFASVIQDASNENGTATLVRHVLYNVAKVYQQSVSEVNLTLEAQRRIMSSATVGFDLIEKELGKVQASGERLNDDATKKAIKAIDRSMTAAMKPGTTEFVHVIRPLFKVQEVGGYWASGVPTSEEAGIIEFMNSIYFGADFAANCENCPLNMEMIDEMSGIGDLVDSVINFSDKGALSSRLNIPNNITKRVNGACFDWEHVKSLMKGVHEEPFVISASSNERVTSNAEMLLGIALAIFIYDYAVECEEQNKRIDALLSDRSEESDLCDAVLKRSSGRIWEKGLLKTEGYVKRAGLYPDLDKMDIPGGEFLIPDHANDNRGNVLTNIIAWACCALKCNGKELLQYEDGITQQEFLTTHWNVLELLDAGEDSADNTSVVSRIISIVGQSDSYTVPNPSSMNSYGVGRRGAVNRFFDMWQEFSKKTNGNNKLKKKEKTETPALGVSLQSGQFPASKGSGGGGGSGGGNAACGKCVSSSLPFPLSVMCYRPYRRYLMGSGVLAQHGHNRLRSQRHAGGQRSSIKADAGPLHGQFRVGGSRQAPHRRGARHLLL